MVSDVESINKDASGVYSMSAQFLPDLHVDLERHVQLQRGGHDAQDHLAQRLQLRLRALEDQLVVHLQQHARLEALLRQLARRCLIMAILMMSDAVPWIGMLIAMRSAPMRTLKLDEWMSGM